MAAAALQNDKARKMVCKRPRESAEAGYFCLENGWDRKDADTVMISERNDQSLWQSGRKSDTFVSTNNLKEHTMYVLTCDLVKGIRERAASQTEKIEMNGGGKRRGLCSLGLACCLPAGWLP